MTLMLTRSSRDVQRSRLDEELRHHESAAREAAALGHLEVSARSILALLDCERRQGAQGPQVLQVIKPRNGSPAPQVR
jgi:hypothetical protein